MAINALLVLVRKIIALFARVSGNNQIAFAQKDYLRVLNMNVFPVQQNAKLARYLMKNVSSVLRIELMSLYVNVKMVILMMASILNARNVL